MKVVIVLLLAVVSLGHAEHRGRDYVRDKICQEFNILGKDNFRSLAIILNSKKFSNATFEEISHLVKEVVSLAETCCVKGADPNCYETGSSALSVKSCDENAPYPDHPGIAACCTQQGLERKLCLAALHQPPKEFPTYVEPSNEELCEAFKKDPQDFADRFTHEYSSNYGQAPLPVLVGSIKSYLSMVGTCCISPSPTVCFLKERLERKTLSILTTMSNRICSRYAVYGKEKSNFSILTMFAQKIPSASFEDISPLAEDSAEVFSKCCSAMAEDCMQKELSELTTKICTKLSSKDEKISDCCKGKNLLENYLCMYSLQPAKSPQLPEIQRPTDEQLCTDAGSHQMDQYTFEMARRRTNIPEVFLSKVYDATHNLLNRCCTTADLIDCVSSKRPQLRGEIIKFLAKADELCGEYNDLTFLEFKQKLKESFSKTMPDATPASLTELVERRADFASTCCIMNAPPVYCGLKINAEVGHTCDHDSCMLI
ncbi:vitamin D-binding protein isoform X1 [Mauremys reevesii]|uniref:vitamin D-binding protein isoform X1 n=1 Tax=Mauremys reevesii TaxID=260615 RepID=UPI00193FC7BF|nr:vitamin D-binding protein isoform X1 [Mauremys reevesii]